MTFMVIVFIFLNKYIILYVIGLYSNLYAFSMFTFKDISVQSLRLSASLGSNY